MNALVHTLARTQKDRQKKTDRKRQTEKDRERDRGTNEREREHATNYLIAICESQGFDVESQGVEC